MVGVTASTLDLPWTKPIVVDQRIFTGLEAVVSWVSKVSAHLAWYMRIEWLVGTFQKYHVYNKVFFLDSNKLALYPPFIISLPVGLSSLLQVLGSCRKERFTEMLIIRSLIDFPSRGLEVLQIKSKFLKWFCWHRIFVPCRGHTQQAERVRSMEQIRLASA